MPKHVKLRQNGRRLVVLPADVVAVVAEREFVRVRDVGSAVRGANQLIRLSLVGLVRTAAAILGIAVRILAVVIAGSEYASARHASILSGSSRVCSSLRLMEHYGMLLLICQRLPPFDSYHGLENSH